MNEGLYKKLYDLLKDEADTTIRSNDELMNKVKKMNDITNIIKIIDNYDELEPVLQDFFKKRAEKEKWNEER
jgi:hypothetical protein